MEQEKNTTENTVVDSDKEAREAFIAEYRELVQKHGFDFFPVLNTKNPQAILASLVVSRIKQTPDTTAEQTVESPDVCTDAVSE